MIVKVSSHLYWKKDISGEYEMEGSTSIVDFLATFDLQWDHEALIVVNDVIVDEHYQLQDGDFVHILTPIFGG